MTNSFKTLYVSALRRNAPHRAHRKSSLRITEDFLENHRDSCRKKGTGWRRLIGSLKLQIIFHKRATKYRSLLHKMTYKDKGSYESSPPCTFLSVYILYSRTKKSCVFYNILSTHKKRFFCMSHKIFFLCECTGCILFYVSIHDVHKMCFLCEYTGCIFFVCEYTGCI